jgi:predicted GNAT superfamily acetyltransferase
LVAGAAEFAACEAMSRDIWGAGERNVVPRELLLTMQQNGGLVHGAFLPTGQLIGFCFAFAGVRSGHLRLCSHQLGVLSAYRGMGIGVSLKEAQADDARTRGYDLISWTFDPLEARNAYINLHRLGCIARIYDRDHYGPMDDALNRGLPSDRLEAEFWLDHRPAMMAGGKPTLLLSVGPGDQPVRVATAVAGNSAVIEVPGDFQAIKRMSMELARTWRIESRAALERALAAGLVAADFQRQGVYIMRRPAEALRP